MAKIHTHYDNLKVARKAPQEVIRAAYKALSQKYHPDKNQGDEKAARIMAILNTAYGILGEPARRREHDEWIAAEEWEIAWLESTRADDGHNARALAHPSEPPPGPGASSWRVVRNPAWWCVMAACFGAGDAASHMTIEQPMVLPAALASGVHAAVAPRADPADPAPRPRPAIEPAPDSPVQAVSQATWPEVPAQPPAIKVLAMAGLVVPAHAPDCEAELHTPVAPSGEPWPSASGYVAGYPVGNPGTEMQLRIDNTANPAAVFVQLYDLDRRAYVRHAYVLAREALAIEQLAAGKYEVRYQDVAPEATMAECVARRAGALTQGAVAP